MNKWMRVIHRGYEDKWDMVPAPWGAHSLSNTGSKLNTGSASWVAHSFIQKHHFIRVELLFTSQPRWNDKLRKHAWEGPRMGPGTASHPSWRGSLLPLRFHLEQEEGKNGPSELWEPRLTYSEVPWGTHQKSRNRITDTPFHQAVCALAAETRRQRGRFIIMPLWAVAWAGTGRVDARMRFCFFKRDGKKALILISLSHMGFKKGLFSFPTYVWKNVSLGIFPLPFFVSEDFVKPARGSWPLFNMKDKGLFVLYSPSEMTISGSIWIRSTSYRVLMKIHLGLGRFLFVYVK